MKASADKGRPLRLDPDAASASEDLPAFLARPTASPVYHGFPILNDVEIDGFRLGVITDFEAEPCDYGDAFVVAPDNSGAGLVWDLGEALSFSEVLPPEPDRWGVWGVTFANPMRTRANARENLAAVLPFLKPKWQEWLSKK